MNNSQYFTYNLETKDNLIDVDVEVPKLCQYCNIVALPNLLWHSDIEEWMINSARKSEEPIISVVYECTNCHKEFLYPYKLFFDSNVLQSKLTKYDIDYSHFLKEIPEEINQISEKFVKIYYQSLIAEKNNLDLIIGVGFRKSIEFLVKDYCINLLGHSKEEISKKPLSQTINMITNSKIKVTALATTWIGNDETHYEKKYTDKDISDMKRFIKSLVHHIASEIYANEANNFIELNKN